MYASKITHNTILQVTWPNPLLPQNKHDITNDIHDQNADECCTEPESRERDSLIPIGASINDIDQQHLQVSDES